MFPFRCFVRTATISLRCHFNSSSRFFADFPNKKSLYFDEKSLKNDEITSDDLELKKNNESWKNEFGTLTNIKDYKNYEEKIYEEELKEDDDTEEPYVRLAFEGRKHIPNWYGNQLVKLGNRGMVFESIQFLEEQMIKKDRVRPNVYVFNTLLSTLGRAGYTYKAFKYFNMMKKYGLKPNTVTYTCLFNSCANAPLKQEGLQRVTKLRELIAEKDEELNTINYHALIKAYGRCGDLQGAFEVADEALSKGHPIVPHVFSFLLMATLEDQTSGFTLAIKLCAMMNKLPMKIGTYHFNLLLRVVRDCGVGSEHQFQSLLQLDSLKTASSEAHLLTLQQPATNQDETSPLTFHSQFQSRNLFNLLRPHPHNIKGSTNEADHVQDNVDVSRHSFTSLSSHLQTPTSIHNTIIASDCDTPTSTAVTDTQPSNTEALTPHHITSLPRMSHQRLALLGGVEGVLQLMEAHGAIPDFKTFSLLLDAMPGNLAQERLLLQQMQGKFKIKLDTTFCNMLIRKRNLRGNFKAAKDVLLLMTEQGIQRNMKTYGCLSIGCTTVTTVFALLEDMQKLGLMPNAEILDSLLSVSKLNFRLKRAVLFFVMEKKLRLYPRTLACIEKDISKMKAQLLYQKKKSTEFVDGPHPPPALLTTWIKSNQRRDFEGFLMVYKQWLHRILLEPSIHPFDLFRQPTIKKTE